MLVLGFTFAVCPGQMGCTRSLSNPKFLSPTDELCIDKRCTSITDDGFWDSRGEDPLFNSWNSCQGCCIAYWLHQQETGECINDWKTLHGTSTSRVKGSFVMNVYSAKGNCFVLPFVEWNLFLMHRSWFVVLAGKLIGRQSTYRVKHARPVESFGIGICFGWSNVSTHFVMVSRTEACEEQR